MSEYVGTAYVRVLPDARGFTPDLDRQIASQSPRTQSLLARSGIGKELKEYDVVARASIKTEAELAAAEAAAAIQTQKLGKAHEQLAIHAHRSQIAGFTIRGTTLGLGAAAVIGAEGLRKLSEALKVTGEEAETTTGFLRNAAAAAISGDFATGAQKLAEAAALFSQPGAGVAQDEAIAAGKRDKQRQDAIALAQTVLDLREKTAKAEGQVGTAAGVTRFQYEKQLKAAEAAYRALAPNLQRVAAGQFGLAPNLGNKVRVAPTDTSRASDFELSSLRAAQTKQLGDDRRLFTDRQKFLQGQIGYLENAGAHTQAAKDRLKSLYGQLDSVEGQIQTLDEQAAAARQARLQNRLALQSLDLQIAQANARGDAQENAALANEAAAARTNAQNQNLDLQTRKGYELQAAQDDRTIYENQKAAAEAAKAAREKAIADAKQAYQQRLSNEEDALNLIDQQAALDSTHAAKQRNAILKRIAFYHQEAADLKLDVNERAAYATKEAQTQLALRAFDKQQHAEESSFRSQQLDVRVQAAQLTKTLVDDKKAINAQIRFYAHELKTNKDLTPSERLNLRSQQISAQLSLKNLKGNEAPRSSASDFFNEAASQFRTQGSNISTAGGILSGQDARAAFAARALSSRNISATKEQQAQQSRNASLAEAVKQTALLTTIAGRLTYSGAEGDPPPKAIGNARRGAHTVQAAV